MFNPRPRWGEHQQPPLKRADDRDRFRPARRQARELVGEFTHVAAECEIGQALEIALRSIRANGIDRLVTQLLRRMGRRIDIESELLQLLRGYRLIVAARVREPTGDGRTDL